MRNIKVVVLLLLPLLATGCGGPKEALACDGFSPKKELIELIVDMNQELLTRQTLSEMEFAGEPVKKYEDEKKMTCSAKLIMYSPYTGKKDTYPVTYTLEDRKGDEFYIELDEKSTDEWRMLGNLLAGYTRQQKQYAEAAQRREEYDRQREQQVETIEESSGSEYAEEGADAAENGYDSEAATDNQ